MDTVQPDFECLPLLNYINFIKTDFTDKVWSLPNLNDVALPFHKFEHGWKVLPMES